MGLEFRVYLGEDYISLGMRWVLLSGPSPPFSNLEEAGELKK